MKHRRNEEKVNESLKGSLSYKRERTGYAGDGSLSILETFCENHPEKHFCLIPLRTGGVEVSTFYANAIHQYKMEPVKLEDYPELRGLIINSPLSRDQDQDHFIIKDQILMEKPQEEWLKDCQEYDAYVEGNHDALIDTYANGDFNHD